ncbi:MAG: hypothetical protein NTX28_01735 [Novosphingobium sp.]|nr:hypothetical protein [Novosphingobium sp.]
MIDAAIDAVIDAGPGFRRRFLIEPGVGSVRAALEDDYHCMAVTLRHDGTMITGVDPVMDRVPWTTCPGAPLVLTKTFTGVALADAARRGEKQVNCTHLYDLSVLAATHAGDVAPLLYDVLVSDPVDGLWHAAIRRNGETLLQLSHRDDVLISPVALEGVSLFKMRAWIETLPSDLQEAARILQWATLLAHGRVIPMERQSDATRMPPNCFTFQEDMKKTALRVGKVLDFGQGPRAPLDHLGENGFRSRAT